MQLFSACPQGRRTFSGGNKRPIFGSYPSAMPTTLASTFTRFAKRISTITGRPAKFILAVAVIIAWAITGPLFNYSDTW